MATTIYGSETVWDATTAESNTTIDVCSKHLHRSPFHTVIIVAVLIVIICNFVILTAVAMNWRMLRHNIVYRYLISCLVSVMFFNALSLFEIFYTFNQDDGKHIHGGVLQRYNPSDSTHRGIMQRNAYRKASIPAFYLIMQLNIAALIYAVSDNISFVGRFSDQNIRINNKKKKHTVASLILVFAWIAPLLLSIPVPFGWNCIDKSLCLPMYRAEPTYFSSPNNTKACSRYWEPMTQSYLSVVIAVYFIVMILMFLMLISTVRKFYKAHSPKSHVPNVDWSSDAQNIIHESYSNIHQKDEEKGNTVSLEQSITKNEPEKMIFKFAAKKPSIEKITAASVTSNSNRTRPALDDTIKLLIVLTLCLFLSDTPLMLVLVSDIFSENAHSIILLLITMSLTNGYCACLPFIMLRYISGLRDACVVALTKCPCLRITVVKKRSVKRDQESAHVAGKSNMEMMRTNEDVASETKAEFKKPDTAKTIRYDQTDN